MKVRDHIVDDVYGMVDKLVEYLVEQGYQWDGGTGVFKKEAQSLQIIGTRAEPMGICLEDEAGNQFLAVWEHGTFQMTPLLILAEEFVTHIPEEPESKESCNSEGASHNGEVE